MTNKFPYEELRSLLMEYMRDNPQGQFSGATKGVIALAQQKGLYQKPQNPIHRVSGVSWELESTDFDKVPEQIRQMLWQFLVQGILVFGLDDINPDWPNYRVTEYGVTVLAQQGPQPYDPDGFIAEFTRSNPSCDQTVVDYLTESVRAFNHDCPMAAGVMLGGASEQLVLLLLDSFEGAIKDAAAKNKFTGTYGWSIHSKFKALHVGLESMASTGALPKNLHGAVRGQLLGAFEHIRRIRNAGGHPALPVAFGRNTLFLSLAVFGEYSSQVYSLIEYFRKNPAKP